MRFSFCVLAFLIPNLAFAQPACMIYAPGCVPSFAQPYFSSNGYGMANAVATSQSGANPYGIADTAIGVLDAGGNVWGRYTLGVNTGAKPGNTLSEENSLLNTGAVVKEDPYTPNSTGFTDNLRIDCGTGLPSKDCSSAIHILSNGATYTTGAIIIGVGAISLSRGYGEALEMPANDYLTWYTGAGVMAGWIGLDGYGNLNMQTAGILALHGTGGLNINGTQAVSCSGIPTSNFKVTDGIVTNC